MIYCDCKSHFDIIWNSPPRTEYGTTKTVGVRDIDKATSPFAYEVSTFDVTPPGAAAIINNPTASSGDIGQTLINKIATKGKIRI